MKKKLSLLTMALVLALTLSACGGVAGPQLGTLALPTEPPVSGASAAAGASQPETVVKEIYLEDSKVEDTLDGLCEFLEGNYAVMGEEDQLTKEEMSYQEIGAKGGYRYKFMFGKSAVQVEVYEFDLKSLNEKATTCLNEVKEKGAFTILNKEVPAILSDNGKYMMIYSDTSTEQQNTAQKERVEKLFRAFHK